MSVSKENKEEKDQLKKIFLSKAKDSRDLIENNIKEIENRINQIVKTINLDKTSESNKLTIDGLSAKFQDARTLLDALDDAIDEKTRILSGIESKITSNLEQYNQSLKEKAHLDEELIVLKSDNLRLTEDIKDNTNKCSDLEKKNSNLQADILILNDKFKQKENQDHEISEAIVTKTSKLGVISSELTQKKGELENLNQIKANKEEELKRIQELIESEEKRLHNYALNQKSKQDDISQLNQLNEAKNAQLKQLEEKIEELNEKYNDIVEKKIALDSVVEKYQSQLDQKLTEFTSIENKRSDIQSQIDDLSKTLKDQTSLLTLKLKQITDNTAIYEKIVENIELKKKEIIDVDKNNQRLNAENELLQKTHQDIEKNISESNDLFLKLKKDLEVQEKQIREKESRIHRLEVLSFLYRISKLFGGIVLGLGLIFIVIGFSLLFGLISSLDISNTVILPVLMVSGFGLLISGIFQLEKM